MALVLGFLWLASQAAGNGGGVRLGEEGVEDPARRVQAGFVQESRDLAGVVGSALAASSLLALTCTLFGWTHISQFPAPLEPLHLPFPLLEASRFLMACALTSSRSHPQKGPSPS